MGQGCKPSTTLTCKEVERFVGKMKRLQNGAKFERIINNVSVRALFAFTRHTLAVDNNYSLTYYENGTFTTCVQDNELHELIKDFKQTIENV